MDNRSATINSFDEARLRRRARREYSAARIFKGMLSFAFSIVATLLPLVAATLPWTGRPAACAVPSMTVPIFSLELCWERGTFFLWSG